jgi:hypothetical protein
VAGQLRASAPTARERWTHLAVLVAAAALVASRPDAKSADVPKLATA